MAWYNPRSWGRMGRAITAAVVFAVVVVAGLWLFIKPNRSDTPVQQAAVGAGIPVPSAEQQDALAAQIASGVAAGIKPVVDQLMSRDDQLKTRLDAAEPRIGQLEGRSVAIDERLNQLAEQVKASNQIDLDGLAEKITPLIIEQLGREVLPDKEDPLPEPPAGAAPGPGADAGERAAGAQAPVVADAGAEEEPPVLIVIPPPNPRHELIMSQCVGIEMEDYDSLMAAENDELFQKDLDAICPKPEDEQQVAEPASPVYKPDSPHGVADGPFTEEDQAVLSALLARSP